MFRRFLAILMVLLFAAIFHEPMPPPGGNLERANGDLVAK